MISRVIDGIDNLRIEQLQLNVEVFYFELFFAFILEKDKSAHQYAGKKYQQKEKPLGVRKSILQSHIRNLVL